MPKLSIIIVNWNTSKLLADCLDSLKSEIQNPKFETEIIVVDNGSTDDSLEMLLKIENCKLKIIENKTNLGFAKGNNIGIKESAGQYIMLLNSDTTVNLGSLKKLVEFLDNNPNYAVSPMLFLPDGKPQNDYYMKFPNLWQIFLYHNPFIRPLAMKIPCLKSLIAQKPKLSNFEVDQLPGAGLMMSRIVWDKVGDFDEDYNFLFEDVDWCWRAKKTKIKRMVVSEAKIIHLGGASWKEKIKKNKTVFYYQFFASMLLFVRKNYPSKSFFIFKLAIVINFIFTLKPSLAFEFYKNNGKQKNFL
jgi:hypothetical protein